jgi:hypothetical protein
MERDWGIPSKSIHGTSKSAMEWNGIGKFLQNRSLKSGKPGQNGTGLGIFFKIDPWNQ